MIKSWLAESEGKLCYEGSQKLLNIFYIFLVIIIGFVILLISSIYG